jgi:hypothetical protein
MTGFAETVGAVWSGSHAEEHFGVFECEALCMLAFVDKQYARQRWSDIPAGVRAELVLACRRAIDLGAVCSRLVLQELQRT